MGEESGFDKAREAFVTEAFERIEELTEALLELENAPDDAELIGQAFRALHTIKGSGSMFGYDELASFAHDIETVFDHVREGKVPVTQRGIDLSLKACDVIKALVSPQDYCCDQGLKEQLEEEFKMILAAAGGDFDQESLEAVIKSAGEAVSEEPPLYAQDLTTYRIRFAPHSDIFFSGTNPLPILNELREMGKCDVCVRTEDIAPLGEMQPDTCYLSWDIVLTTAQEENDIRDVFIFVEDRCTLRVERIEDYQVGGEGNPTKKVGEILVERGDMDEGELKKALGEQKRIGEILTEKNVVTPRIVESALAEQQHVKQVQDQRKRTESAASIRVSAEKLDSLVDLVGELVTVQSRLSQLSTSDQDQELKLLEDDLAYIIADLREKTDAGRTDSVMDLIEELVQTHQKISVRRADQTKNSLTAVAEEIDHLTADLRDNTMSLRMLPIGSMFGKFKRVVRDLSRDLGKEILFTSEGAETEMDKSVIEQLSDPLVHLIRNCVDHGIELPDKREAAGKVKQGSVHLSARHAGAHVIIRIDDDGAGLDPDVIKEKAIERGLVTAGADLTDREIFSQIFAPGFSTAREVSSVSGRGVGMDVVKKNIEALRGTVDIQSEKGIGTAVVLKLPLTLAIIDGFLTRVYDQHFVFPLSSVDECMFLTKDNQAMGDVRNVVKVRGQLVPYVRLREQFHIHNQPPAIEEIVICDIESQRIGFVVDHIVGTHQTVIKSLGRAYRDIQGLSGATITGDGSVALIIDPAMLAQAAESSQQ